MRLCNAANVAVLAELEDFLLHVEDEKFRFEVGNHCCGRTVASCDVKVFTVEEEFFEALGQDWQEFVVHFLA